MRVEPLGESAAIVRQLGCPGYRFAAELRRLAPPGVLEVVPSYDTVGVVFDPDALSLESLSVAVERIGDSSNEVEESGAIHRIPVCYELGEDLDSVCEQLGVTRERLIDLHMGTVYRCYAVGFVPGFAYLGYLPEEMSLKRRPQPRIRVPRGAVGIADRQTGIYPTECPGGWHLIGWTPVPIERDEGFLIAPGDQVQFVRATAAEVGR